MDGERYLPEGVIFTKPSIRKLVEVLDNSRLPTETLPPFLAEQITLQNHYMTRLCGVLKEMNWLDKDRFAIAANEVYVEALRTMLHCDEGEDINLYVDSFNEGYRNSLYRNFLIDYSIFDPTTQLLDIAEYDGNKEQIDKGFRHYMMREHGDDAAGTRAAHEIALFERGVRIQSVEAAEEIAHEAFHSQHYELMQTASRGWTTGRS